jgi:predicted patatin/cPLA2 family phospholipase
MCCVSAKRFFYLQFCMRAPEGHLKVFLIPQSPKKIIKTPNPPIRTKIFPKKLCFVPSKCEGAKNSYRATQRNLQTQQKIKKKNEKKKFSEHQINQSEQKFSQKTMFSALKMQRSQKFVWGLPDGICRLNPKS